MSRYHILDFQVNTSTQQMFISSIFYFFSLSLYLHITTFPLSVSPPVSTWVRWIGCVCCAQLFFVKLSVTLSSTDCDFHLIFHMHSFFTTKTKFMRYHTIRAKDDVNILYEKRKNTVDDKHEHNDNNKKNQHG